MKSDVHQQGRAAGRLHPGSGRTIALGLLLCLTVACASTGKVAVAPEPRNPAWAAPIALEGVPNLHKVNDQLYRSAQPTQIGMQNLEKMGIRTVINLREFHDDNDEVVGTHLRRIDVPMYAWNIKDEKVVDVLKELSKKEQGPYLVHCMHGADRTGVVNAMYRILFDGWDKQKAIDEMRNGGYGFHEVWANIIDYVSDVDVEKMDKALKSEGRREAAPVTTQNR